MRIPSCRTKKMIAMLVILQMSTVLSVLGQIDSPKASKGIMDLRDWQFGKNGPVKLEGEWEFYWYELINPADVASYKKKKNYRYFPKLWEFDSIRGERMAPQGHATHRLRVILNSVTPELAISIPHFYSAYILFINGEYVASNGQAGISQQGSNPHWQFQTKNLRVTNDTLDIVLQISNFRHSKGGSAEHIRLGEKTEMQSIKSRNEAYDLIMASSLFFIGLFFMVLFSFGRHDKHILFFALFCLFYSYRAIGSGTYTFHTLYPSLPWLLTLRMEYLSMFLAAICFAFYSYFLYREDTSRLFLALCVISCGGFSLTTILFSSRVFTELVAPFAILILVGCAYLFYTYVKAVVNRREGSLISLVSTSLLFFVIGHVILVYFGFMNESKTLYFLGYQQFFFFQSIILFYKYSRKLEIAKEKAEQAAKARSDFLSMISHEIRTPLNAVIGLTNYLISDKPKKAHEDDLKTLKFSAENLHVLINDVLDYSKLDAGKIEFERRDVNVIELAENIIKGLETKAKEKNISLLFVYDKDIPSMLRCDGLRLSQILTNLVGNAIKFTKEGGVTLNLTKIMGTKKRVSIKFLVEDTGIGIPKDKLEKIFESFSQASTSTTREYGGTGLGLSITKKILDLQNTKIHVFSREGIGSRFYFTQTFPVSETQEQKAEQTFEEANDLDGKDILLVEDNAVNVMVAKKFLSKWSINVDVAENGREALEKVLTTHYDLILMDLQMPVMDGYAATKKLREHGVKVPIIALTASVMLDVGDKVYSTGMNDFITKPFNPRDLYKKIKLHIKQPIS